MQFCKNCLYPNSKPDLIFDAEGVCSACRAFEARAQIDWAARADEFRWLADDHRTDGGYDCIVPVSGGKDSTYQVVTVLKHGLHPLCVSAITDDLSPIGRRNLDNIRRLGVDLIEVHCNPIVRRKINRICLSEIGDISWPEHVTIFTVPVRIAVEKGIKLIIWGENSQNEYGGPGNSSEATLLDRRWLEEFGGLLGLRVRDLDDHAGIRRRDQLPYEYPEESELRRRGVRGVFLGQYFPWDGLANAILSQAYGFETLPHLVEGSLCNYENLDNHQAGIHDYFKYLKFGFGRATDIACNHIRRGRLSREDAIPMVRRHDGKFPSTYLGKPLKDILAEIGLDETEFDVICDRFTNKKLFSKNNRGELIPLYQPC